MRQGRSRTGQRRVVPGYSWGARLPWQWHTTVYFGARRHASGDVTLKCNR